LEREGRGANQKKKVSQCRRGGGHMPEEGGVRGRKKKEEFMLYCYRTLWKNKKEEKQN